MDNSFQTSFIPKKPINSTFVNKAPVNVFLIFAFIVFFIVLGAIAGLYFYKTYLIDQKSALSESLVKISNTFEPETIKELETFDNRSSTARQVLENHIVLSPMFETLGELTIPAIQFTEFEHEVTNGEFYVKMSGMTKDYKSIALQADVFSTDKGKYFKNPVFSNLEKDKNKYIHFDLEFIVDPALLSYEQNVANRQLQPMTDTSVAPVSTSSDVQNPGPSSINNNITN